MSFLGPATGPSRKTSELRPPLSPFSPEIYLRHHLAPVSAQTRCEGGCLLEGGRDVRFGKFSIAFPSARPGAKFGVGISAGHGQGHGAADAKSFGED